MCLAIPMKIVRINGKDATVKTDGLERLADVSFIKNPKIGDYVIVHAGFAMERLKPAEAKKTLKILKDVI